MEDLRVELSVPATTDMLRLVRMTASGLASRIGLSFDEVDDLRLALDEICHALIGAGRPGMLHLAYGVDANGIEVEGSLEGANGYVPPDPQLSAMGSRLLASLVDAHEVRGESGRASVWLRKERAARGS